MKRQYIIPNTTSVLFRSESICQLVVASVKGNSDLNLGGGGGSSSPIDPM